MKVFIFVILSVCGLGSLVHAQSVPKVEWQKMYGGSANDEIFSLIQTHDGGYAAVGLTNSPDGQISEHHDSLNGDVMFLKLDASGKLEWYRALGGLGYDVGNSLIQTFDGGYALACFTLSTDGDVTSTHGVGEAWIIKLNDTGDVQWKKCYGGSLLDGASSIIQTKDSGYFFAGYADSHDGDITYNHNSGFGDGWLVKLNSTGVLLWQKCIGGALPDGFTCIIPTFDGGFALAGNAESSDGDLTKNEGDFDGWMVKVDSLGKIEWQRSFGGSNVDYVNGIIQTRDSGFALACFTGSKDADVMNFHGKYDGWVVKITSKGTLDWDLTLGGSDYDEAMGLVQTANGDIVVANTTNSTDGEVIGKHGSYDAWLVALNENGEIKWQECIGSDSADEIRSIIKTSDGGFAVAGATQSAGTELDRSHGGEDAWVVKLSAPEAVSPNALTTADGLLRSYPNPVSSTISLAYNLPTLLPVMLTIYDALGRNMKTLVDKAELAGEHSIATNVGDLPIGTYCARLQAGEVVQTRKIVIER